ncbi:MAG: shikimate dehydrogenase [Pseudomonadales bacterium]|nr:shikimate dehydrogenase [Pseudomonadales bacterium]
MQQYAVMGNPVEHSLSPKIHATFAQQTGEQLQYQATLVANDKFAEAVTQFFADGGKGLNVTVPFKEQAFALAQVRDQRASAAKAVNTLWLDADGRINGSNTDGLGLLKDLTQNHQLELTRKNILVLGAGGAVRGVLKELLGQQPTQLIISNRTAEKAQTLAAEFQHLGPITAHAFAEIPSLDFDLVVNGTSASLHGKVPAISGDLLKGAFCYDMMYGSNAKIFLDWALQNGASAVTDGLGMLVEQAAEAFNIWRDVRPNTTVIIDQLR